MPGLGPNKNHCSQNEPKNKGHRPEQHRQEKKNQPIAIDYYSISPEHASGNKGRDIVATGGGLDGGRTSFTQQPQTRIRSRQPARHTIPYSVRLEVLQRFHNCCCLCGASFQTDKTVLLEIDHITPVSRGGTNDPGNLQILCRPCNQAKSNRII